jgi:hypothetical protein
MEIETTVKLKNKEGEMFTLKIMQDNSCENPRTSCDNLGTMVFFHKRYDLGDKDHGYEFKEYDGWDALEEAIEEDHDPAVIMPVYMYDHSGTTLAVHGFGNSDPMGWDWGQVGFMFISKEMAKEEYGELTKETLEKIEGYLVGELKVYDNWRNGRTYGFTITKDVTCSACGHTEDEEVDSCWGFIADDEDEAMKYILGDHGSGYTIVDPEAPKEAIPA